MALNPLQRHNVNIVGKADALQTLVFVHGLGTDQTAWQDIAATFADNFRIVLFDNLGSGKSDSAEFSIAKYLNLRPYAEDLVSILDYLQLDNAVLVGHSMGAMICALGAIKSSRAAKLIMLGANPRYLDDEGYLGGLTKEDIDHIYQEATTKYMGWTERFASSAMANPKRPELAQHFAETLRSYPPEMLLSVLCSVLQTDYRQQIEQIRIPTLIIQADNDVFVPMVVAEYLHSHIRDSQLQVINASGHLPHISAPDEVVKAIRSFV